MAKAKPTSVVYQLKIALERVKPPVWRRIEVADVTLPKLHDILQSCMGWDDFHLHLFTIDGEDYSNFDDDGMEDVRDERRVKLSQLVARGIKSFTYTYDFGDSWEHLIKIEKVLAPEPGAQYPRCLDGARACPPEDCGGTWGYEDFLKKIKNPKHPEHAEMLEWSGGDFDPEEFDPDEVTAAMQ